MVYFCYIDESGTPTVPGNTSHYILTGISIPIKYWKKCDRAIYAIKRKYGLENAEIHTGWILRNYKIQSGVPDFEKLTYQQRRLEVERLIKEKVFALQKGGNKETFKQPVKNFDKITPYIHLTEKERVSFIQEIANLVGKWSYARIFAECIDKVHFSPSPTGPTADEQALEQVVSRFETYMSIVSASTGEETYGVLIHDNNQTVAKRHTNLMKKFHKVGTLWTDIKHIIETPLFVDSELTSLVQIADMCAYALRRYFENNEDDLLNRIKNRFDKKDGKIVGVRHYTKSDCSCVICS